MRVCTCMFVDMFMSECACVSCVCVYVRVCVCAHASVERFIFLASTRRVKYTLVV